MFFISSAYANGGLPFQGSDLAVRWDFLYNFLVGLSAFFTVLVLGAMVYFAIAYRKRPGVKSRYITGSVSLEVIWTAIPTVLLLAIFAWGYMVYNDMTRAPSDAYEVKVIGKQWLWQFQYDDGRTTINELYVPLNKPVKLVMTSEDVLHSFFVPNFRVKQDVVPGMYTSVWFEASTAGKHQIFCTEYCGASHSLMLAKVIVLEDADWEAFKKGKKFDVKQIPDAGAAPLAAADGASKSPDDQLTTAAAAPVQPAAQSNAAKVTLTSASLPAQSLALQGKELAAAKGCVSCHSVDGSPKVGPSYKGIYGRNTQLEGGAVALVDENYIRESIENPSAKIVKGYKPGMMPTFKGLLRESELNALIAYVKSLK